MADETTIHIGENSPEQVAYKLMQQIAASEGFVLGGMGQRPNREWLIRTYSQCLYAIRNPQVPNRSINLYQNSED
jgi:hypothetical protein